MDANRTYLIGLIGRGIAGSRSPDMHEREAAAVGIPLVYRRIDFDVLGYDDARLGDVLRDLQKIGFDGTNVTHPFKQRVLDLLDTVSPDAQALGAVNTVVFRDGARHGFNTDWTGFRSSLKSGMPDVRMDEVTQIGCGGAGSAVAYALLSMGVRCLRVFDRDREKATLMAQRLERHFPNRLVRVETTAAAALEGADGVVQTSPIGMTAHPGLPFSPALLRPDMWLSDVIYFPIETELLQAAARLGCRTQGGGGMAVYQAAEAFRLMTGITPSTPRMLERFNAMR